MEGKEEGLTLEKLCLSKSIQDPVIQKQSYLGYVRKLISDKDILAHLHLCTACSTPALGGSTREMRPMNTRPSVGGPRPSALYDSGSRATMVYSDKASSSMGFGRVV